MSDQYAMRADLDRLEDKLDRIDNGGTRGVAVLAVQIQNLAQDFARHEQQHQRDTERRASSRKWWIATVIAVIAAVDSPIVAVWLQLAHR